MAAIISIKIDPETTRNKVAVAMQKRYPRAQTHKDRRTKRQNKNSWQKEVW